MAAQPLTLTRTATLSQLFSASEAALLEKTLPADRTLQFRLRETGTGKHGVLVYISPTDSGELPPAWAPVLESKSLLYIAADGFGNSRPTAERVVAALGALRLARKLGSLDEQRLYIAGMSGGGRVASQVITHFPELFSGALCIVGADYFLPQDETLRARVASRRLVLLTGSRDFNYDELRLVYRRYQQGGMTNIRLMDVPDLGHEQASRVQLTNALEFLDGS
jgi:pimeloyl-ACP methyl ester carboxylesterase